MAGYYTTGVDVQADALTGDELIPIDTGLSDGVTPTVAALPVVTAASGPVQVQVPLTGFAITAPDDCLTLIINPAGTLATGTLTLPANPREGQEFEFVSTQTQTALTVAANTGHTLNGTAVTALTRSIGVKWRFLANVWHRTQ